MTYTLACLCVAIPSLPILIFGRFLGGISTSILFSAFESWLITAASSSGVTSSELSSIMGRAALVNGLVASAAGVVSNKLVSRTQNFVSPFAVSGLLLLLAWVVIRGTWVENYGGGGGQANTDPFQVKRLGEAWKIVRKGMICPLARFSVAYIHSRSSTPRSGPHANMFRRIHVPLRLHLGPITPRATRLYL